MSCGFVVGSQKRRPRGQIKIIDNMLQTHNFNPASKFPLPGFDHKAATHLIPYSMSYTRLIGVMVGSNTKCYKPMGRTHP